MSQILWKNSFGKVVFPFWWEILCREMEIGFFGRHFVTVYPIFDFFFAVFWFFLITLSVARISAQDLFGKVLF